MSTGVVLNNRKDTGKRQYCPPLPAMDLSNLDSTAFAKEGYSRIPPLFPIWTARESPWGRATATAADLIYCATEIF